MHHKIYGLFVPIVYSISTDRRRRDVAGDGLEVVQRGRVGSHEEVDGEEEAGEDDTEGAADAAEEDVLLVEEPAHPLVHLTGITLD